MGISSRWENKNLSTQRARTASHRVVDDAMLALLTCDVYAIGVVLSARIGSAPLVAAAYPAYVNVPRGSFDKGILDPDILVDLFLPFVS
jgi:hypothetical protein